MDGYKKVKLEGAAIWKGHKQTWRKGDVKEVPEGLANILLGLHKTPFVGVKESEAPQDDKMLHGTPDNKGVSVDSDGKPIDNQPKSKKVIDTSKWGKRK